MYINVFFTPHPPIIIKEIGREDTRLARCTIEGMTLIAKKIAKLKPETIIFITPHGNSFSNGTCLLGDEILNGDFTKFGNEEIKFEKPINVELTNKIFNSFEDRNFIAVLMNSKMAKTYNIETSLDHGVMVPMYFIDKYYSDYNIVHITPGQTPLEENYFLGKLMKDTVDVYSNDNPSKVVVVASGDLSHALKSDGPYSFNEKGPVFDQAIRDAISHKNPVDLVKLNKKLIEEAAQCGLRSFLMGFGYMDGILYDAKVYSYEGPFGVGYLTGYLESNEIKSHNGITNNRGTLKGNTEHSHMETITSIINHKYESRLELEDDYIKLARMSIEHYVKTSKKLLINDTEFSKEFLDYGRLHRSGVFVSIHSDGQLRGCIGTTEASSESLIDEIIYNAISACSADPRFHPVEEDELKSLEINVDVLMPYEAIESMNELDVKEYGVIVEQAYKRGLLLPNLEGIHSVDEQVSIAKQKAGIVSGSVKMYRFKVERHEI